MSKRRKELAEEKETYVDLHHPRGEAQVDFGTAELIYEQKIMEVKYLALAFPYSNAAYIVVLPKENIECFLYGLQTLFEYAGGVSRKIWFDNLSTAVVRIEKIRSDAPQKNAIGHMGVFDSMIPSFPFPVR